MEIIYLDQDIIVVSKPPGIPVHGGLHVKGPALTDFLTKKFPEIKGVGEDPARPGIVHRLDKDTSGVMVVARNQKSFETLKKIFQERRADKTYWAIVCGKPKERQGMISLPIGRMVKNPLKRGVEQAKSRIRGAREAITEYRVLKAGSEYSLVELWPKTGRMHQLRVHMKALGHPVACDKIYGGKNVCCPTSAKAAAGKPEVMARQLLHAKSLSFSFPEGRKLHFEADPPEDFSKAVEVL
ncbi:MAG: RluA family pseudouridine synthase [Candidatus Sungbacteria bacterium]|nr:RluA family pseudouridine synthase [Candidatus Sungbacteria bacterium]